MTWLVERILGPREKKCPIERFHAAVSELNDAWDDLPNRQAKPWIDWEQRCVVVVAYNYQVLTEDEHKRMGG